MPVSDWAPSVADVGAILRSRTVDPVGNELGTFTEATRPTAAQVTSMISMATGVLVGDFGADGTYPEGAWTLAKRIAALDVAMDVELSYYPEQVAGNRSPYEQLKERRDTLWTSLERYLREVGGDGEAGPGDDGSLAPAYGYPEDLGGMVGWGSNW